MTATASGTTVLAPLARRIEDLAARARPLPPWALVLVVYALTRVFAAVLLDRTARFQGPGPWGPADPDYLAYTAHWDGAWYGRVAVGGYPEVLPRDAGGDVTQNVWAFYPLFPATGRAVMEATGLSWPAAAGLVAVTAGAAAVVLLRTLLVPLVGPSAALWSVVLVCCFPAAPVLQLAYAESLALLLLVAVLLCLQRGRYLTAVPLVLLVGLTRPIAVPLAVVVLVHAVAVLRRGRAPAGGAAAPRGAALVALLVLLAASGLAAVLWPVVAAVRTGVPSAYTATMAAWRAGQDGIQPFLPWVAGSRYAFGHDVGPLVLSLTIAALAVWVAAPSARALGTDLRAWTLAYGGYLLLVLSPSTSLVRYLLLAFPLGVLTVAASPSPAYRRAVAAAFLAGQVVWVFWLWRYLPAAGLPAADLPP